MGRLKHAYLNIDADGFLNEPALLVKASSLWPLLHLFAYTSNFNNEVLVGKLLSNLHASGHASHLNGCTCDTSVALSIMLFNVDALVTDLRGWVNIGSFV